MPTLRIAADVGCWVVSTDSRSASVPVPPTPSPRDEEDARWYFEEFLEFPDEPAPTIAARVEARLGGLGEELFRVLFSSEGARSVWTEVRKRLNETRVEIDSGNDLAEAIPWELIREPGAARPLALTARSFVRVTGSADARPEAGPASPLRILLVICRPAGTRDVPFRSVANHLVRGLDTGNFGATTIDVLRPPTFARLETVLREASRAGCPYQLVHFDGHGIYQDLHGTGRPRGFVLFENPSDPSNNELVHGQLLGTTLAKHSVSVLVLNACRSAHAEASSAPERTPRDQKAAAFGSFAREAATAGVAGVVAMRYNVHVDTAARFVADLYARLARGATLSDAVTAGRHALADNPIRDFSLAPRNLADWVVPVLFEAAPVAIGPLGEPGNLAGPGWPTGEAGDTVLPIGPVCGFVGRDDSLLALDRAFDKSAIALLISWAGEGKTTTATEFARWYRRTGGVGRDRVLYTSCSGQSSLSELFEAFRGAFLDRPEVVPGWEGMSLTDKSKTLLQVMIGSPVLWIWDDLECASVGTPGGPSAWTASDRAELGRFFQSVQRTNARILLVSRRTEAWLGNDLVRERMSWLVTPEVARLARAFANRVGMRGTNLSHWSPLLVASGGNPSSLLVLIEGVLAAQSNLTDQWSMYRLAAQLSSGDAGHARWDRVHESLGRWFQEAVPVTDLPWFSILHWFRGIVSIFDLEVMGLTGNSWHLRELTPLSVDSTGAARALDAASEAGLLHELGGKTYGIHAGLSSFLRKFFMAAYPTSTDQGRVARAYVGSFGDLSNHAVNRILDGDRTTFAMLQLNERNLIHAWRLAIDRGWLNFAVDIMQGLEEVFRARNQFNLWRAFVDEIEPLVSQGGQPNPRWHTEWAFVQEYKQRLAIDRPGSADATAISAAVTAHWLGATDSLDGKSREGLSESERNALRSRAVALGEQGLERLQRNDPNCLALFEEAVAVAERIGDVDSALRTRINVGMAYGFIAAILDFGRADMELVQVVNELQKRPGSKDLTEATLALTECRVRFLQTEARAGTPDANLNNIYNAAITALNFAGACLRQSSSQRNAGRHAFLTAELLVMIQNHSEAVRQYQEAIKLFAGDLIQAAIARYRIAYCLDKLGKPDDAHSYREEARRLASQAGLVIEE